MYLKKIIAIFLCGLLLASCSGANNTDFITIEKETVSQDEYRLLAYDQIALVSSDYHTQKGLDANEDGFWDREVEGTTPLNEIKNRTNPLMKEYKGTQLMALERGLLKDISYQQFLKDLSAENKDRQQKLAAGEPIYGLSEFNELQYYSYRQSQIEFALKEHIMTHEVKPTEEVLLHYYEQIKEKESGANFIAEFDIISWNPRLDSEVISGLLEEEIARGRRIEEAVEHVVSVADITLELSSESLVTKDMGKETRAEILRDLIAPTETGRLSQPYVDDEIGIIVYVQEKEWEALGSFEENRSYIEGLYREQAAEEFIAEEIEAMSMSFGQEYENITFDELFGE